ncbi:MAG: glycosyltransferase [Actinobacteria bacterium]|nr:glycosyltransferase [Actinomycetota bacterium]
MTIDLAIAIAGLFVGLVSIFPARLKRRSGSVGFDSVSIIIPARNEERNIGKAIASIRAVLGGGVEVIVADDHSSDRTSAEAAIHGATVISVDDPPQGWAGKPQACWQVVFMDADVRLGTNARESLIDAVVQVSQDPKSMVSMQPWHTPVRSIEHFAMLFNVVSVMASRCRGLWVARRPLAFGPLIVCDAAAYRALGGHGHESVRGSIIEDVVLGKLFERGVVNVGSKNSVTFRMYDTGLRGVFEGFVKNFASAGLNSSVIALVGVVTWFVFLCSPLVVGVVMYPICVAQLFLSSRVVGRFTIVDAVIYPVHLVFFVAVLCVSVWRRFILRTVSWKDRSVQI